MKRKKNLERAIVLGLILSTGVCGSAWAESIIDSETRHPSNADIMIDNDNESQGAIQLENKNNVEINLITDEGYTITLDSAGSGIRTQSSSIGGSIALKSGKDNVINFSAAGNGIDADSNLTITLNAVGNNIIESSNTLSNGGDGVNIGANQSGKILFEAGVSNIITVSSDGIYTEKDSNADSEYIATLGNNEITAGNNGIDHRGNGNVTLTANYGSNIINTTDGDGIRTDGGSGNVFLSAKENEIVAGDNGVQSGGEGTISIIASNGNNNINASNTAIEVSSGTVYIEASGDVNLNTQTNGTMSIGKGIHLDDDGNNNGYGNNEKDLYVDINTGGNFNIGSEDTAATSGIHVDTFAGTVDVDAEKGVYMNIKGDNLIGATESGHINIDAKEDIVLNIESNGAGHAFNGQGYITNRNNEYQTTNGNLIGINGIRKSDVTIETEGNITFTAKDTSTNNLMNIGIFATGSRKDGDNNIPVSDGGDENNKPYIDEDGYIKSDINNTLLKADKIDITIGNNCGTAVGVLAQHSNNVFVNLESVTGVDFVVNSLNGNSVALDTADGNINIKASNGSNLIKAIAENNGLGIGIQTEPDTYYQYTYSNRVNVIAEKSNNVIATTTAISNNGSDSIVTFQANKGTNYLKANDSVAIDANDKSQTNLTSQELDNIVEAGIISTGDYGNQLAINALSGSKVTLKAGNLNRLSGGIYADGIGTSVYMSNSDGNIKATNNYIRSYAVIDNAGNLDNDDSGKFEGKSVISALYAQNGANIKLTGENDIATFAIDGNDAQLERTVWAYDAGTIEFDGATTIRTDSYSTSKNSDDIAIAAGTGVNLKDVDINEPISEAERAKVTVTYNDYSGGGRSSIEGDILAAYAGKVDIKAAQNSNAGIKITGNLLSGNNGILNVGLGNGGYLEGRIDDYQDAGTNNAEAAGGHLNFYNPAFSSTIYSTGTVNLDMGTNSYWRVTGQSWVTSLTGDGSTIDMRNTDNNDTTSHAVHIGTLTGDHTFVMDLNDTNHNISDMLYIKDEANSSGTQTVYLNTLTGLENMADGDKLRFATVNAGTDKLTFVGEYNGENGYANSRSRVMLYDTGFNNAAFRIENETYNTTDTENVGYNGDTFDTTKPGNEYVDSEYGNGATNWYLTRNSSGDEMSDAGKTILNMSRANYSNAIYMDRLNKRLGEARYINGEEEDGMWVRIRHDRIGKTDAYRSQNTMYELGYDKKQDCDNGERRVGFAIDYMHGDTGYNDIAGKGELDRYGLWLYDTWLGNKGHYADYVAKWGHLDNEFEIYAPTTGEKIDGDYSNNVFSISAEYGRKKDIGGDWYFEPQIQAQLARVTGADYTTSQGTKVSVDGINSLIGRAGFRLGKDFGEEKQSTVYIKADVLHEFLGDQDIKALDATTNGNWSKISYENEGTWYDVGLGFAAQMSKNSYAFLDLERSFGHDNDETYQINVGMQWSF